MQDPRLDSLMQYTLTAVAPGPTDEAAQLRQQVADLWRIVNVLLRTPNVQTGAGAPTLAARDGTLYIDTTGNRIYARTLGVWKSVVIA